MLKEPESWPLAAAASPSSWGARSEEGYLSVRCSENPSWLTAPFLGYVPASLHLWCWKRKWNSRFSCVRWTALKSPSVVEKRSRAARSGAGFLSESQAGCWICSCSLPWQRANSNTAVLICFSVSWTFVCHFPIQHHTSLNRRLKFPAFYRVVGWIAVLFGAICCHPTDTDPNQGPSSAATQWLAPFQPPLACAHP